MKSLIGHNQPPKDRKADWKSISVHKDVYKKLEQVAENMLNLKNCFLLLDGEARLKRCLFLTLLRFYSIGRLTA